MIKQIFIIILWKLGLYRFDPVQLHREYLQGDIPAKGLFRFLAPENIPKFIEHHNLVKEQFQIAEDLGLNSDDELSEEALEVIEAHPLIRSIMRSKGVLLNSHERRRMFFMLSQLDALIADDLEKKVLAKNKMNVVTRIN